MNFKPARHVRNHFIQSTLASLSLRRWFIRLRHRQFFKRQQYQQIKTSHATLDGYLNKHQFRTSKGLITLIHGWEGSAQSVYLISLATYLYRLGYDTFRLQMRDHGETHSLNKEIFHSLTVPEVKEAISAIAEEQNQANNYLIGFSLGGNFALRAGIILDREQPELLNGIIAVSPPITPANSLASIESHPVYRKYFVEKWHEGIAKKQNAWPNDYDFSDALRYDSVTQILDYFIQEGHTPCTSSPEYLHAYRVPVTDLEGIQTPTNIITAKDDLVIPWADTAQVQQTKFVRTHILEYGGHCGFMLNLRKSWLNPQIGRLLSPTDAKE